MADEKARGTSPARLALGVAAIVALAWLAARAALSPQGDWLWRDALGRPPWPPVMVVAAIEAPLYLGAGVIAAASALAISRCLRRGERRRALASAGVGLAGCLVLASGLSGLRRESFPPPDLRGRVRPGSALDVFTAEQWWALAAELREVRGARPGGRGVAIEPQWIPYDGTVLSRFSFLGMTSEAVIAIFGPTRRLGLGSTVYRMNPVPPEYHSAYLSLRFDYDDRLRLVVVAEHVDLQGRVRHGRYDPAAARAPVVRRAARDFPDVPEPVRDFIRWHGCQVPQPVGAPAAGGTPANVVSGEFARGGQTDWAVLCSRRGRSGILVWWGGEARCGAPVGEGLDSAHMKEQGGGGYGFSRRLSSAGADEVDGSIRTERGQLVAVSHDAIAETGSGHGVVRYYYCDRGVWRYGFRRLGAERSP